MKRPTPLLAIFALLASGCATRGLKLPEGPGEPLPGYEQALAQATAGCRDVRTLTAEAGVAGSVGGNKIRGRVIMGFERPGRIRLEGVAPIGAPVFILAADAGQATLLLPRAKEVLRRQPTNTVLEALIGMSLGSDDLLALLAGCVVPDPKGVGGRQFAGGWARVDLEGGNAAFLRQESGTWRLRAGLRHLVSVEYDVGGGAAPAAVRLRSTADGGPGANLRLTLSQVETNAPIAAKAFDVTVPPGTLPITLHDLQQSGVLGERR